MRRTWIGLVFAGALAFGTGMSSTPSTDGEGIPVEVRVLDEAGQPIPTAVVRHPDEAERHRVNTVTGSWRASVLYLPSGETLVFDKGQELEFEISAPGYMTESIRYLVRKRKNVIVVQLQEMEVEEGNEDLDDPVIQFGRDKPIGGVPIDEAQ